MSVVVHDCRNTCEKPHQAIAAARGSAARTSHTRAEVGAHHVRDPTNAKTNDAGSAGNGGASKPHWVGATVQAFAHRVPRVSDSGSAPPPMSAVAPHQAPKTAAATAVRANDSQASCGRARGAGFIDAFSSRRATDSSRAILALRSTSRESTRRASIASQLAALEARSFLRAANTARRRVIVANAASGSTTRRSGRLRTRCPSPLTTDQGTRATITKTKAHTGV